MMVRRAGPMAAAMLAAALAATLVACRGEPPRKPATGAAAFQVLVDSLVHPVEQATGLNFRHPPRAAVRTRAEAREYIVRQMDEQMPGPRLHGSEIVYKLTGLLPDTANFRTLVEDVLTAQILGYYDPETSTLYGVAGANPALLRIMAAHELVHALQHQYLPLDSIFHDDSDGDRAAAAQAVLEGQANFASLAMVQGKSVVSDPAYWERYAELSRSERASLGLAGVPMILRERLLFPYRDGGAFMAWWGRSRFADTVPYGPRMPTSSEQILHPDRYASGDAPIAVRFTGGPAPLLEDDFGEIETRILADQLAGLGESPDGPPLGWGGDRFRAYDVAPSGALVWYSVWDDERSAAHFRNTTGRRLMQRERAGYRTAVDSLTVDGRPAARVVIAPAAWSGWRDLPAARLAGSGGR